MILVALLVISLVVFVSLMGFHGLVRHQGLDGRDKTVFPPISNDRREYQDKLGANYPW